MRMQVEYWVIGHMPNNKLYCFPLPPYVYIFYDYQILADIKLEKVKKTLIQENGIIFWLNFDHVNFSFGTFIFT